jgi:FtsH-binding integral membrane protein
MLDQRMAVGTGLALSVVIFSEVRMLGIPRRFSHFVYGVIQSGLTCAIAAGIASFPFTATGTFVTHWLQSWFVAWFMMLPIVLFAAPAIRSLTHLLTRED